MSRWLGMVVAPVCMLAGISTTFAQSPQLYAVAGLALGSRIQFDSSDYREYKCSPSEQFAEFTWCQKTRQERDRRRSYNVTYSILHSRDGTVLYVNRFQEPVFFGPNEANEAIRRNSIRLGTQPRIERLPRRLGFPEGVLATWGKVTLEALDSESINTLAEGRSPRKGYLIDFIGNFTRSAKEGLPIYRVTGGAGFLWVASYDQRGRGTLRYAAIDPSAIHPTPLTSEAPSSDPQSAAVNPEPTAGERANENAPVDRQGAEVALREAKEAAEKAKADAEVARNGLDAANRDAQLAKAEAERLSAETSRLNASLEQLETEKTAAETKARTMESVAYGALAILIAFLVSPLIVKQRKAPAAKRQAGGPETEQPQANGQLPVIETKHAPDTAGSSPKVQAATSHAHAQTRWIESDLSPTPRFDTFEERVMTLTNNVHLEAKLEPPSATMDESNLHSAGEVSESAQRVDVEKI